VNEWGRIDGEIVDRIKAAKIRLRFDRVVRALCARLNAALVDNIRDGQSVVITVTAPIRRPSETAAVLEDLFCEGMPDVELRKTIHGNHVRVRPVTGLVKRMPKLVFLVHNPDSDPCLILEIAESRLRERSW
jgi:hypothetical protein